VLLWQAKHGEHLDHLQRIRDAGERVPELDDQPELAKANGPVYSMFLRISSSRSIGMALGPIPSLAIGDDLDRYWPNLDLDEQLEVTELITEMDGAYLKHHETESKKKSKTPPRK
jgi:hypothetical protein